MLQRFQEKVDGIKNSFEDIILLTGYVFKKVSKNNTGAFLETTFLLEVEKQTELK